MIRLIMQSRAVRLLGGLLAALGAVALWGASRERAGRKQERKDGRIDDLEGEIDAHDRITGADTGVDLSDHERAERLHRIGDGDWRP